MKIKILTPMSGVGFSYSVGDTPDIEDAAEAKRWIAAGHAETVSAARSKPAENALASKAGVETTAARVGRAAGKAVAAVRKAVKK